MRIPALQLKHPEATRARLVAQAKEIPGAWVGMRIAALLLVLEGQQPAWIVEVLGLTHMSLNRWIHGVNARGLRAVVSGLRPGRPGQLTPTVGQALATQLQQSPEAFGLPRARWGGPTLVVHLRRQFGIQLSVTQAQRWLHLLGYRLERARRSDVPARTTDPRRFQRARTPPPGTGSTRDRRRPR
jgi:transposase